MEISPGIHIFEGEGVCSNIYLIDEEILVDTGILGGFEAILDEMKSENIDFSKISVIINTHGHYDHIGGNKEFKKLTNARICAHRLAAKKIESGKGSCFEIFRGEPAISKVNSHLETGNQIVSKRHAFNVVHTPGHTDGGICLYEPERKILISGDTLFSDSIGRTDLPTGSLLDMVRSLKKIKKMQIDLLLPGHGSIRDRDIKGLVASILCQLPEESRFS
jgi:glyoxylase-like metal-dependent hydrolase (beta-lactamase superfamily II)